MLNLVAQTQTNSPYPAMHFTPEQVRQLELRHLSLPQWTELASSAGPQSGATCVDLSAWVPGPRSERNQHSCGDCWQWGATAVMEVALYVQHGISDRLSIQFLNSCNPNKGCCDAGAPWDVADFYDWKGYAIPWSNPNAGFNGGTCVSCSSIGTNPRYNISSITDTAVSTWGVSQATAISRIKAVLDQNKAIAFMFLTMGDFSGFWNNQSESAIWSGFNCGQPSGGHTVVCVGYCDDGTTRYWLMLNSWGAPANRPHGLFRVAMDIDYSCKTSGGSYSLYWEKINLAYNLPPIITKQPVSSTNCQGASVTFTVETAPGPPLTYQWQKDGTNLNNGGKFGGATSSALSVSNVTTNEAGTYSVTLRYGPNANDTTNSAAATLTVWVPPDITAQPQGQTVCRGDNVRLSVTAAGAPLYYQWQCNGTNIADTLSYYSVNNAGTNRAGDYTCIVSNGCGVITSAVATLKVQLPPAIDSPPRGQVIVRGANIMFCVSAADGTFPVYSWQFNGAGLVGASSCYSLNNVVQPGKAGPYTAVLSNSCGVLTSSVAWLTLVMPLSDQIATQGTAASFTVTNYGADPSLEFQWQHDGTDLTDNSHVHGSTTPELSLSDVTTNDAGTYTVIVSNDAFSSAGASALLSIIVPAPGRFNSVTCRPDGALKLDMSGQPGCTYVLEATTNWVDWASLATLTCTNVAFQHTQPGCTSDAPRFYRLRADQ